MSERDWHDDETYAFDGGDRADVHAEEQAERQGAIPQWCPGCGTYSPTGELCKRCSK